MGLVACANTAGNNLVLGSTLEKPMNVILLVKERAKRKHISFTATKKHFTEGDERLPFSPTDTGYHLSIIIESMSFHYHVNILEECTVDSEGLMAQLLHEQM